MHVKSRSEAKGKGGEIENIKGRGKEGILGGKLINSHTYQHKHAHTHTPTHTNLRRNSWREGEMNKTELS